MVNNIQCSGILKAMSWCITDNRYSKLWLRRCCQCIQIIDISGMDTDATCEGLLLKKSIILNIISIYQKFVIDCFVIAIYHILMSFFRPNMCRVSVWCMIDFNVVANNG